MRRLFQIWMLLLSFGLALMIVYLYSLYNLQMANKEMENDSWEKTSLVLMGFSPLRFPNLITVLTAYGNMPSVLDQIIVVWCNEQVTPPVMPTTPVPILLLKGRPSLNSRFNVSGQVRTRSVLQVDNDVIVTEPMIQRMASAFSKESSRIIGVERRTFDAEGRYHEYSIGQPAPRTIAITDTFMLHRDYLDMYMRDPSVLLMVDENRNCEDIAMNFVVRKSSGLWARIVPMDASHARKYLPTHDALRLSVPIKELRKRRGECVRWLMVHYWADFNPFLP